MTMDLGYLLSSAIFLSILVLLVILQIAAKKFHPFLYWATIVASTTAGTTMADFATRSLGIGYLGGSSLLFASLMAVLALWHWSLGSSQHAEGGGLLLGGNHGFTDSRNGTWRLGCRCRPRL